jgi:hypothetical protein
MSDTQRLSVREKQEVREKHETTAPGRFYTPPTDIYETEEALTLVMEIPGADRESVNISLENDALRIEAQIDLPSYEGMEPVYTEYGVGNFARFESSCRCATTARRWRRRSTGAAARPAIMRSSGRCAGTSICTTSIGLWPI